MLGAFGSAFWDVYLVGPFWCFPFAAIDWFFPFPL